jgi:hypothetical protein
MLEWDAALLAGRDRGGTLMHGIVISGATILNGTGAPSFTGEGAIEGERIVSVGGKAGPAHRSGQDTGANRGRLVRFGR